ncbi:hypothetical protein PLICRDRAFT_103520 [Plicaturopsis crispa FD-325 SS-3]|nr:hypothetical protein PLICRDRAFT_103520 [Plicaturopsis crispa FD-325 SS-3]
MAPSNSTRALCSAIRESKNIVAVAGAGLSAASGLPTFRGAGGLWRSYNAISLATPEAFNENPSRVWQFYHMRREAALRAAPNAAHLALAALQIPERLRVIAPSATFTLITQNVDGLSPRALQQVRSTLEGTSASTAHLLYEMHGRILDTICTGCGDREANLNSPICPALAGTEGILGQDAQEPVIPLEDLPRCQKCGSLLRPGVVWFGEMPLYLDSIDEIVEKADLALIVGTSATVYPAAGYAEQVKENGGKVAIFNLERTEGDNSADFLFLGPCETTLPQVLLQAASN